MLGAGGLIHATAVAASVACVLLAGQARQPSSPAAFRESLGTAERCAAYSGLPGGWPASERAGMVWVADTRTQGPAADRPGLWVSATPVTRAQYARFLQETGQAEGSLDAAAGHAAQTEISPAQAAAYARWRGQRLPSAAELARLTAGLPSGQSPDSAVGCLAATPDGRFWTASLPLWAGDGSVVRNAAADPDTADAVGFVTVSDRL